MKRAIIIAKGKVQKVGYRDFVQDSARELGITGEVENLEDGNVKIVCEGKEAEIKGFIENIEVKQDFIDVSEISVRYEEPTDEFKVFKIKYGDVAEELGDRIIELIQNIKQESFFSLKKPSWPIGSPVSMKI